MTIQKLIAALAAVMAIASANATEKSETTSIVSPSTDANKTEFIFHNGNNTCKFVYNLDEQGRVTSKVRYTLNANGKWNPNIAYSVHYGETETIVTCAGWSNSSHAFNKNATQIHLNAQEYPVAIHLPK